MKQEEGGDRYFWDTYAIAELMHGNPNYAKYSQEPIIITIFNLVEIYWIAIREYNENEADKIYGGYSKAVIDVSDEILKKAIKFRKKNKGKDLSYADCIGYVYAVENNMKFLTGDNGFKDFEKIEFVK